MGKRSSFNFQHLAPITTSKASDAWTKVWNEVETMGFGCRRLATCRVWLGVIHTAYGYQWFGDREDGRHCGDIILPSISLSRWADFWNKRPEVTSVTDVLRHEYAHAYADVNRRRIETKKFEKAFGGPHNIDTSQPAEYSSEKYVTHYATFSTAEDFAEVFWYYLKHKGKLPKKFEKPAIRKKWDFITSLRKQPDLEIDFSF